MKKILFKAVSALLAVCTAFACSACGGTTDGQTEGRTVIKFWPSTNQYTAKAVASLVEEYNDGLKETLYNHAITGREGETVMSTVLPSLNAVAVYSINKDLKLVIDDHFADVRFSHVCAPVWNHLYRRSFTGVRRKLYVYFHDKKMDVFGYQQNRFKFSNCFDTNLAPDAVYFILNVWKQLAFDNHRDELHLVGELPDREALMKDLHSFVQNVYVINPKAEFNRAPITEIKGLPYDLITYYVKN